MQLARETGGKPQSQVVLQFLRHCVDALPQCYIVALKEKAHETEGARSGKNIHHDISVGEA